MSKKQYSYISHYENSDWHFESGLSWPRHLERRHVRDQGKVRKVMAGANPANDHPNKESDTANSSLELLYCMSEIIDSS